MTLPLCAAVVLALSLSAAAQESAPPPSALATADSVLQEMSRITGLPIKAPLKKQLVSRSEIERYLKENLHAEYTAEELHGQEATLKAFGVVGPDFDLESFLVGFYTEQAAGFYDPRRQTMFMADWIEPDMQKLVLAHELTHALQDQNFDLWKFMHATRDDDDATTAREALVEGYATLAMLQETLEPLPVENLPSLDAIMTQVVNQQIGEFPEFSRAPFFLRFELLFPYVQGMSFNRQGLKLGGWKRLNETFTHPPATTKQIFQPEAYFGSSTPGGPAAGLDHATETVELPPSSALEQAGLKQVETNVMGELGYYSLVSQLLSEEAAKVTQSWVRDRYRVYEGPAAGQFALITRTRWSSPQAAREFCSDYRTMLEKRWPESARQSGSVAPGSSEHGVPEVLLRLDGPRQVVLWNRGSECRSAEGVPAAAAEAVAKWLESLP